MSTDDDRKCGVVVVLSSFTLNEQHKHYHYHETYLIIVWEKRVQFLKGM